MTRGKHGISAAARQAVSEGEQQIAAYQHSIRKLTAEAAALKQQIADLQAAHSKTIRVLKVERDEGLSPQLTVLQKENEKLKDRADRAQRECQKISDTWQRAGERMMGHFMKAHGLTGRVAIEEFARLCGGVTTFQMPLAGEDDGEPPHVVDFGVIEERKLAATPGALEAIQRARGERK